MIKRKSVHLSVTARLVIDRRFVLTHLAVPMAKGFEEQFAAIVAFVVVKHSHAGQLRSGG